MMLSLYHGGSGTFRSASDFDFFRGVFFEKTCPALCDDGEIGGEPIKKKKAFSDVGDQETILKERWTAAKFVQHQLRVVLGNQYDPADGPPEVFLKGSISHTAFMKLVKPALGYIAAADARAMFKSAVFMVFSKEWIYYRPPPEKEVEVARPKWPRGDLWQESRKPIIANFKAGGPAPDDYEEKIAWETEWLKEAFHAGMISQNLLPNSLVCHCWTVCCKLMVLLLLLLQQLLPLVFNQVLLFWFLCLASPSLSTTSTRMAMPGWRERLPMILFM